MPKTFPRIEVPHEVNFAQACKGEAKASAPFEYSSMLTETMLLGIAALRAGQGKKVLYDAREHAVHERGGCESVPDEGIPSLGGRSELVGYQLSAIS